ncbi:unnamed protein product [Trichogramma brassicae]|uniref:Uncharacterized protein n=1 Tax=Trichogramma brassicae TaxID=86971 RepID=A0A6H5HXP3_9HYME|nr:unnamed protein product [Trichogramma brassicae]
MSASNDGSVLTYENWKKLERLQSLRANVNWKIATERRHFLYEVEPLFDDWHCQVPNLRDFFSPREIDWLLESFVKSSEPKKLIEFVVRTGYVDEPELGEGGRPVLRRTTPIHIAARRVNCHEVIERGGDVLQDLRREGKNFATIANIANVDGKTPLHVICDQGDHQKAKMFFKWCKENKKMVRVDAKDKCGRTPLQYAVSKLEARLVDLLILEHNSYRPGCVNLSSLVLPTEHEISEQLNEPPVAFQVLHPPDFRSIWRRASQVLSVVESLIKIKIKSRLSLYDLLKLRPEEARKLLTSAHYFSLADANELSRLYEEELQDICALLLYEMMMERFCKLLALVPFLALTHYRLPISHCEIILEKLPNEDLFKLCLLANVQN